MQKIYDRHGCVSAKGLLKMMTDAADKCDACHEAMADEVERLRELLDVEKDKFDACLNNHCESNMAEVDASRDRDDALAALAQERALLTNAAENSTAWRKRAQKAEAEVERLNGRNLTIPSEHSFAEREKLTRERDEARDACEVFKTSLVRTAEERDTMTSRTRSMQSALSEISKAPEWVTMKTIAEFAVEKAGDTIP
jgi:hypothetical protein